MVVAVKGANGEMVFGPVGAQRILADDTLVAIGKEEDLRALGGACSAEAAR
jgi:K+/H+ antiporter YhaU regulatory subunit KhtT